MKDLIITALNEANIILEQQVPKVKSEVKQIRIEDVEPLELIDFMKTNNIPDNAWFGGIDNGYDGFSTVCLNYDVVVPATEKDRRTFRRNRFTSIAFRCVSSVLSVNGYNRTVFNSAKYKEFSTSNIYDMYSDKEFDRLVEYYSLSFTLS